MDSNKIKKGLGRGLSSLIGETKIETQKNQLSIANLIPNKNQPRKNFDETNLEDLTNSIKERGMIQPIIVRQSAGDKYEIIAGERRWLAAQRAGLHNVPVVVTEPLIPGSIVEARIIGVMKFDDGGEVDDKVIAVLSDDKRMEHIKSFEDLGSHWIKETTYYWEHYKDLKKPGTCKVNGFLGIEEAIKVIEDCEDRYKKDIEPNLID